MRANSSSTSEVPIPIITPEISAHGTSEPVPTDMKAPVTNSSMPGTA